MNALAQRDPPLSISQSGGLCPGLRSLSYGGRGPPIRPARSRFFPMNISPSLRGVQRRLSAIAHSDGEAIHLSPLRRYGLLRGARHRARFARPFARNDDVEASGATKQPAGQISKNLSSPLSKNIPLSSSGKSALPARAVSPDERDGSRSSRTCGEMRWTRRPRLTSVAQADGEDVWSWRPDAGVKFVRSKLLRGDGGKKARSPGRARNKP